MVILGSSSRLMMSYRLVIREVAGAEVLTSYTNRPAGISDGCPADALGLDSGSVRRRFRLLIGEVLPVP